MLLGFVIAKQSLLPQGRKAERICIVQPGKEKTLGCPNCGPPVCGGVTRKMERAYLQECVTTAQVGMNSN